MSHSKSFNDKLLKDRIILLGLPISDEVATEIIASLLFLEAQSKRDPITLYINSPGGSATAGLAILDTMHNLKTPVHTVCSSQASAMAAIILSAGSPGNRSAVSNATISFAQVTASGAMKPEHINYLIKLRTRLIDTVVRNTKMPTDQVEQLFESARLIAPTEARALGVIDTIVAHR